ncbi:MAG: 30S ribosomal protein S4 [Patescibacteria group bacterium]|nr:MAG: 30S ribosomal protein S4 [Patescibacteria group bacterium]
MGRNTEPKCKQCRREGEKLYLKGEKCLGPKCPVTRRAFPPGQHGPTSRAKITPFGVQLRQKQKAKRIYGLMEKQFENYFVKAASRKGDTGVFLKQFLEMRFDNIVFRLGFAKSRAQARQMVGHGLLTVNGKSVDIPSYQLRAGDQIAIKENKINKGAFKELKDRLSKHQAPGWLTVDAAAATGKVINRPTAEELEQSFDAKLIVEFYSR